jgi:hypothetical protein
LPKSLTPFGSNADGGDQAEGERAFYASRERFHLEPPSTDKIGKYNEASDVPAKKLGLYPVSYALCSSVDDRNCVRITDGAWFGLEWRIRLRSKEKPRW